MGDGVIKEEFKITIIVDYLELEEIMIGIENVNIDKLMGAKFYKDKVQENNFLLKKYISTML